MKLQLDVTNKKLVFETGTKYREFNKLINIIVDNTSALDDYIIEVGTVPNDKLFKIDIPATSAWDIIKDYKWLEYKGIKNIKINENNIADDKKFYAILKDGIYNIEM